MSRVSLIEQLYTPKKKSALEFDYDALWAPPIRWLLSQEDINELYRIATSLRYNGNIEKKYELIDAVMRPRGFRRGNCGTNRVVYNFLEDPSFCMKIALDRVGIKDSPAEFKNQEFFKPFCCKIFEVDPSGVIACIERVNPISSLEEFLSIADDVFNMMITKIIGKYVVDDLGADKFMNYGIRYNSNGIAFGPVVIDFPYAYELDGAKLRCGKEIIINGRKVPCYGEIDYDDGLNNLICQKCGKRYTARDLARDDTFVYKFYGDDKKGEKEIMRGRIISTTTGKVVKDSGLTSKTYVDKEKYENACVGFDPHPEADKVVGKTIVKKYTPFKKAKENFYTSLQNQAHVNMLNRQRTDEPFNPVIKSDGPNSHTEVSSNRLSKDYSYGGGSYAVPVGSSGYFTTVAVDDSMVEETANIVKNEPIPESANEAPVHEETVVKEQEDHDNTDHRESSISSNFSHELAQVIYDELRNNPSDNNKEKEDTHQSMFSEEMEQEVFPEMRNDTIMEREVEDTEEEDIDQYSQYFKDSKAEKRYMKNSGKKRRKYREDMSDY